MKTNRPATVLATAALAVAALAAAPVSDDASATVDGSTIVVSGTIGELPSLTLGTDAADDATVPGIGVELLQLDVRALGGNTYAFDLVIDPNPATGHTPTGAQYGMVVGFGSQNVELVGNATPLGVDVASQTCTQGAASMECTTSPVDGGYADGAVTWELNQPAQPGSNLFATEIDVNLQGNTPAGSLTFPGIAYDEMAQGAFAQVPGAYVLVGGDVAGTARFAADGSYTVSTGDLASGTYTVGLQLCGFEDCRIVDLGDVTVE